MLQLARPEDRAAIEVLAQQVHRMHVRWQPGIFEMHELMWSQERYDQAVTEKQLFCAKIDGNVAGYVLLRVRDYDAPGLVRRKVLEIDEICVDESLRGRGIGTEMMIEIRAIARAFCCTDLQLGVVPQNDTALAFYQKCGFRIRSIHMHTKL